MREALEGDDAGRRLSCVCDTNAWTVIAGI